MRLSTCLALCLAIMPAQAETALPPGFVRLRDAAPDIAQSIRYATSFNFTGAPVPGYDGPSCVLTRPAAEALARADKALRLRGYALVVFDCYRPLRSVRFFVHWTLGSSVDPLGTYYHPDMERRVLVAAGYIAAASAHSRGSTVDVGLIKADDPLWSDPVRSGKRCDMPQAERMQNSGLDLGTSFDCFSARSALGSAVGQAATANRALLRGALEASGFRNYRREWWHFTYSAEPFRSEVFDFTVD